MDTSNLLAFWALKTDTWGSIKRKVAVHLGYYEYQFRMWLFDIRPNKTIRPDMHLAESLSMFIVRFRRTFISNTLPAVGELSSIARSCLPIYLDMVDDPCHPDMHPDSILVFLKYFDAHDQSLNGIGREYELGSSTTTDLITTINKRMVSRWSSKKSLRLYRVSFCYVLCSIG